MLMYFKDDAVTAMDLLPDSLRPGTQAFTLGMSNMQVRASLADTCLHASMLSMRS